MQKLVLVFDLDIWNVFKFVEIVCDDDQFVVMGMVSNYLVIRFDRCFFVGQFGMDLIGMYCCLCIVIQNFKVGDKFFYDGKIMFWCQVFFSIVNQFY